MWDSTHPGFGGFSANESNKGTLGGGFMSPALNDSVSEKKPQLDIKKTVCPTTVKKILQVPPTEDNITLGGAKMAMVTVCGTVVTVDESSNKIIFKIDDKTGPYLSCQYWISASAGSDAADVRSDIVEKNCIRVTGSLRILDEERVLMAYNVRKITDYNELVVHWLEIIHTSMAMNAVTQGGAPAASTTIPMDIGTSNNVVANSMNGLNTQQNMVFQAVLAVKGEDGASINFLCQRLGSMNKATIKEILEFLNNEGHVYSTIDEDHYKATEA